MMSRSLAISAKENLHPEPPNCPKMKFELWLRDFAPEVLEVVSEQPPDFEGLIPSRLKKRYLDFLKEELLQSLIL